MNSFVASVLVLFGVAGSAGLWMGLPPWFLLVGILWLPGNVASKLASSGGSGGRLRGPGRLAVESLLALFLLIPGIAPLFFLERGLGSAPLLLGPLYCAVGLFALIAERRGSIEGELRVHRQRPARRWQRGEAVEWVVAALCLAVLLPVVLAYAGGKVDDWWDLAFVRAFAQRSVLSLHEPILGGDLVHPRFAWNVWLLLQALICKMSGADPVLFQQTYMPAIVCVLSVSGTAALASAVFSPAQRSARIGTLVFIPLWLYGTEAFPFFNRLHQDKFVAALVAAPTLFCLLRLFLGRPTVGAWFVLAAVAAVACSIHSIVFGFTVLTGALLVLVWPVDGTDGNARLLSVRGSALLALSIPLLYPLWQWLSLACLFAAQGISLGVPGNPVVRAHLWLDRLLFPSSAFYIVKPSAVFGPVALLALPGLLLAWRDRREGSARVLLVSALLPCVLAFVPGLAALVGRAFVPWMLYRIVWLVPVAVLGGSTLAWAVASGTERSRWIKTAIVAVMSLVLVVPIATDRYRRGMGERPFARPDHPIATTLHAYGFLASAPVPGAVLAPMGFSGLVPAMTGRPAVAISERGTLVFSRGAAQAYTRLRDRAEFFANDTDPRFRLELAKKYGAAYAVFRRRYITRGSESRLLRRYSAEGFLLRTTVSAHPASWSHDRDSLRRGLPSDWPIVFENDDFWIVRCGAVAAVAAEVTAAPSVDTQSSLVVAAARKDWLEVFDLDPETRGQTGGGLDVLAGVVGYPSAKVAMQPVPLAAGNADQPIWATGGALWDDGPATVELTLDLRRKCTVDAVQVVPFLRKHRREVFELKAEDRTMRTRATDGQPITLPLNRRPRSVVRIRVRSLLGRPFGLSDVRVIGREESCDRPPSMLDGGGGVRRQVGNGITMQALLDLAGSYPYDSRPAIALARKLALRGSDRDAEAVLASAVHRDPGLANGLVELGLVRDRLGASDVALALYERAARVDSGNAWAQGCLAWAEYRRGRPLRSLYHAQRAAAYDERYADAFTIRGLAARSLGLNRWAMTSFRRAMRLDPDRDWPYLEMASSLAAERRTAQARLVLERYLQINPGSRSARLRMTGLLPPVEGETDRPAL